MRKNTLLKCLMLLFVIGTFSTQPAEAQKLKNLWKKVKKEVGETVKEEVKKIKDGKPNSQPQTKEEKPQETTATKSKYGYSLEDVDKSQLKVIKAPNEKFQDILLEQHKGLLRFGINGYYGITPTGEERNIKVLTSYQSQLKNHNYKKFKTLLELKYLKPVYDVIDKENLTKIQRVSPNERDDPKIINARLSLRAQNHLKTAILTLGSKTIKEKYFCNDKNDRVKCSFSEELPSPYDPRVSDWGGYGATVFEKKNVYSDFAKNHLDDFYNWSENTWKENVFEAYVVLKIKQWSNSEYDFKKNGFWINYEGNMLHQGSIHNRHDPSLLGSYIPKNRYEKDIISSTILFPMEASKAEEFLSSNKLKTLSGYAVYKVKITPKGYNKAFGRNVRENNQVNLSYSLASPIIELYLDTSLTNKIGEIDLTKVVEKFK